MKNLIRITAILAFFTFVISCNDNFLERYPLDKISDANYWQTANDLKLYVNNLYYRYDLLHVEDGWGSQGPYGQDADNGTDTQVWHYYNTRMNGEKTVATDNDGWGNSDWEPLRSINYFMDHYKEVENLTSFDAVKQYVGEALFFRSIFYFTKLRRYGDLPWASSTVTMTSEVLFLDRLPRNQVVDSIMFDLDRAVDYLPAQAGGTWTGRVTKETAMALQSRIALYEGTWEKYHDTDAFKAAVNQSTKFLEKAAKVSDDLIALSEANGYPALDNVGEEFGYRDLFNQENYANSREVIFWKKFEEGVIANLWDRYSSFGAGRGATKSLIDSYLKDDGTPVTPGYDDATLLKVAENRDPRLAQTIQINDGKHFRWQFANPPAYFIAPAIDHTDPAAVCPTGYQIYKGHNFRYADMRIVGLATQGQIFFRYGEILLNYAEAKAELGTITQADLDKSINKLRDRVNMPHLTIGTAGDPNFEFSNLDPIIQEVRRERKVELACEGFRHDDIMRWAAAGELIVGKIPLGAKLAQWIGFKFEDYLPESQPDLTRQVAWDQQVSNYEVDANGYIKVFKNVLNGGTEGFRFRVDRDYLYPIPTNQLTLNSNMKQNPGWD